MVALSAVFSIAPAARPQEVIDDIQVQQAIDLGIGYLRRKQGPNGNWDEHFGQPGGVTALVTLALLSAGVPPEDPQIQTALAYLRDIEPSKTYSVALQTMVFCTAFPERDLALIRRNVNWLGATQDRGVPGKGGWSYPGADPDNSNSQFALLALHEAERVGVSANNSTWRAALGFWLERQNPDGSWSYGRAGGGGSGSMTSAGIASVVIADMKLQEPDARYVDGRLECCAQQATNAPIERALDWMGAHFSVKSNPGGGGWVLYYLYALERVGRLTAARFIGGHDWYREGADHLVRAQDKLSGFWLGFGREENEPQVATSFALLFLSKGRRPVLMSKLEHGPQNDWNRHRHDVANLTAYTESRWKRELSWQIIDPRGATTDDLLQSPILFFNGREAPDFSDEEVQALREYVNRGGFLFAEACCGGEGFDQGFRELMKRMYPEPEHALHLLPPEHAVWHAEEPVAADSVRPLWGIDVGCRTSIIYSPEDLSCYWELSRSGRDSNLDATARVQIAAANAIGINVLAYATNREVKHKLEVQPGGADEETKTDALARANLHIAKLRHGGSWNAAPRALIHLQEVLSREFGMRLDTERHDIALTDERLFGFHLAFMHGRTDFRLSAAERTKLKDYVERGGTIMADAVCGSEEFGRAFRREMAAIFPDRPLEKIPATDPMFTPAFGGFDVRTVTRRDPQPGRPGEPSTTRQRQVEPELEGIQLGDRYAVIFSPYDLSCALEQHELLECRGYVREDAARLAINVLLYSLH